MIIPYKKKGNYKLIKYSDTFICLDRSNESIGMTLQTFTNIEAALQAFNEVAEKE